MFAFHRLACLTCSIIFIAAGNVCAQTPSSIDFVRDIRPILSNTCFTCHGPDQSKRDSDLRLDTRAGAFANLGDRHAIRPGDVKGSELIARIESTDPDLRMPPPNASRQLSPQQRRLLRDWVAAGAKWKEHWAFRPPVAKAPTPSPFTRYNAIDDFVAAALQRLNRKPSAQADKATLIRRVSLDLTGLPPTLEEVDAFLADDTPQAYERVVDRLLASETFGERMAMNWLDVARYADTSGYQNDGPREMWRWRDWVIQAYNQNMPFDDFTIHQLAGDLLANDSQQQDPSAVPATDYQSAWRGKLVTDPQRLNWLIASAFNRNHRGNAEGGIIPEEYQVEYVVDRVDTTATVWLGLTLGCARCHDHKYDPLKQQDFYRVFAFFNNVPEFGRAVKEGNSPPYIKAPTEKQRLEFLDLEDRLQTTTKQFHSLQKSLQDAQRVWEAAASKPAEDWTITDALEAAFPLDGNLTSAPSTATDPKWVGGEARFVAGKVGRAIQLDGKSHIDAGDFADFGYFDMFSIAAWIRPSAGSGVVLSRMKPVREGDGYSVRLKDGHVQVNLVKRWLDDSIRVETAERIELDRWTHVAVTYDGSREPRGLKVYFDGKLQELVVKQDFINQTFAAADQPVRIGGGDLGFTGAIDDVRIFYRDLSPSEVMITAAAKTVTEIVTLPAADRNANEKKKLSEYFLRYHSPEPIRSIYQRLFALRDERFMLLEEIPTLMVMQEMAKPRTTHILNRGEYNQPGKSIGPAPPETLPPMDSKLPRNRLGLAKWVVSPENPLTARVAVNRAWQLHFGVGLVRTSEDFGVQGEPPTHPQLLDWLAVEFVRSGWDVKSLHKRIVMSATYRQSSRADRELLDSDPENRWLARGPRNRLPAELVRDQALAISGLLTERIGGPSVFPYQPEGLWKEIATDTEYPLSEGDDLYRRSLYTFWKRTVAPPTMSTLDAPSRESCIVRRSRTNTPLQALALMNEVSFVEAARAFATRVMREGGEDDDSRLTHMFRLATSRRPKPQELAVLRRSLKAHRSDFAKRKQAALRLLATGDSPVDESLDPTETAALTMVASLILNLDEVINKE